MKMETKKLTRSDEFFVNWDDEMMVRTLRWRWKIRITRVWYTSSVKRN